MKMEMLDKVQVLDWKMINQRLRYAIERIPWDIKFQGI